MADEVAATLRGRFLAAVPDETTRHWEHDGELGAALVRIAAEVRVRWPQLSASDEDIALALASRIGATPTTLAGLDAAALVLTDGCVRGDPTAVALFVDRFAPDVEDALRRRGLEPHVVEDLRQVVFAKLIGPDSRLRSYSGRGELARWVRAVAVREALELRRSRGQREIPVGDAIELDVLGVDAEETIVKDEVRAAVVATVREAIADLGADDRALLRDRFARELTLDQLAAVHGVHRATAARWLASLRDRLRDEVTRRLQARFATDEPGLVELLALVRSRLELTLDRLLSDQRG